MCEGNHRVQNCNSYKQLTPAKRYEFIKSLSTCGNCLGNHLFSKCESRQLFGSKKSSFSKKPQDSDTANPNYNQFSNTVNQNSDQISSTNSSQNFYSAQAPQLPP